MPVHEAGVTVPDPGLRPEPRDVLRELAHQEVTPGDPPEGGCYIPVEDAAGENGCTGIRADGQPCNGRAGDDGRCARHKET